MDFHEYSKSIVEDYLGTVAYVDDLIYPSKNKSTATTPINTTTTRPTRESVVQTTNAVAQYDKQEKHITPNIDPRVLTDSFSNRGIHCALLELNEEKSNIGSIKKTLTKSDVIILDWQMHSDNGQSTCDLIEHILTENKDTQLSLRLIVIYTDQPAFNIIIHEHISPIFIRLNIEHNELNEIELQSGHTKILIIPKSSLYKEEKEKISGSELPEKIIEEMTKLTSGLVSNYALESVISIRKNTHKLLGIYNKNLDPGYLSHKMLLANPEDSKDQIVELIGSEIKSIIKSNHQITEEKLKLYFDEKYQDYTTDFEFENKDEFTIELPSTLDKELLLKITEIGIENYFIKRDTPIADKIKFNKSCHKYSTKYFTKDQYLANEIDKKCSMLSSMKGLQNRDVIYLQQGSIVFEKKNIPDYWLCIQPKCDGVRIEKSREFIFLKLKKTEAANFNIILPTGEMFEIDYKVYNSTFKRFKSTNGKVIGQKEGDDIVFILHNAPNKFHWLGELKNDFAQHVSNQFATQLSRVGINHYEWLRRS